MTPLLPHLAPLGDAAITIALGTERSPELLARVHATAKAISAANIGAVEDVVPAYLAVTVFYDYLQRSYAEVAAQVTRICESVAPAAFTDVSAREHVIPVRYGGADLPNVAAATGLGVEEVIARHSSRVYTVDILGFVPGFAYLSELDETLALPRREQPRPRVAAGSVAIAGRQTAVYPLATPGGWHIIGATDTVMFDPLRPEPALLRAGDRVRFEAIR